MLYYKIEIVLLPMSVNSLVLSSLHYSYSMFYYLPALSLAPLNRIINCCICLVFNIRIRDHFRTTDSTKSIRLVPLS